MYVNHAINSYIRIFLALFSHEHVRFFLQVIKYTGHSIPSTLPDDQNMADIAPASRTCLILLGEGIQQTPFFAESADSKFTFSSRHSMGFKFVDCSSGWDWKIEDPKPIPSCNVIKRLLYSHYKSKISIKSLKKRENFEYTRTCTSIGLESVPYLPFALGFIK